MDEKLFGKLNLYVAEASKICKVDEVYLFGSSVKSEDWEQNDVDLAIISDVFDKDNYIEYMTRFLLLSGGYRLNVEPHLFNKEDSEEDYFNREIVSKGIRLLPLTGSPDK